jgi:hypothetical protein
VRPRSPPAQEIEKIRRVTLCGVRRKVFWVVTLVVVLVILAAIGGGLAALFASRNKTKNETSPQGAITENPTGTASSKAASLVGGVPQTTFLGTQLITIPVTTDGTVSLETVVTTITYSPPSATVPTSTSVISTGLTTPIPTNSGDPCSDTLLFSTSVTWAGVSNTLYPPQVLWKFDLPSGSSCCSKCWSLAPQKCNVWGYFPLGHPVDDRISCAIVYDYPGSQKDAQCPAGRPLVGLLPGPTDAVGISGNVGGPGPCAGPVYTQ